MMAIRTALVGPGDDLYRLAARFYGDASAWTLLRNANPQLRGDALVRRSTQIVIPEFNGLYAGNGLTLPGVTFAVNNSVSIPATDVAVPPPPPPPIAAPPVVQPVVPPTETVTVAAYLSRPTGSAAFVRGGNFILASLARPRGSAIVRLGENFAVATSLRRPNAATTLGFGSGRAISIAGQLRKLFGSTALARGEAFRVSVGLSRPQAASAMNAQQPAPPSDVIPGAPLNLTTSLPVLPGAPQSLSADGTGSGANLPGAPSGLAASVGSTPIGPLLDDAGNPLLDGANAPLSS